MTWETDDFGEKPKRKWFKFCSDCWIAMFVIVFFAFIVYAIIVDSDNKDQYRQKCASAGGIVLYNRDSEKGCYRANTQIILTTPN